MLSCWRRLLLRYFTETESSNSIIFCCKLQFLINYQMWYSFSTLLVYQRVIRNTSVTHISLPVLWLTCSYSSVVYPILWTFIVENSNLIWVKIKYVTRLSLIILKDNRFSYVSFSMLMNTFSLDGLIFLSGNCSLYTFYTWICLGCMQCSTLKSKVLDIDYTNTQ